MPFATSYLCEAGFSAVTVIKSKYRNKIDIKCEMRVAISKTAPRFDEMCVEQQAHCLQMLFSVCILNNKHDLDTIFW